MVITMDFNTEYFSEFLSEQGVLIVFGVNCGILFVFEILPRKQMNYVQSDNEKITYWDS